MMFKQRVKGIARFPIVY